MADIDTPISKIIGILTEKNGYGIFIKTASSSIASINIRDILSAMADVVEKIKMYISNAQSHGTYFILIIL